MYLESCCVVVLLIVQINSNTVEVKLNQGKLIGIREQTIFEGRLYYAFYGVPYAKPPIGIWRFKDPQLPKKWKVPFDATVENHGACAQAHIVHKHLLYGYEDCLNLNIYTPGLPRSTEFKLRPVAVWIHGYAFSTCLSHIHGPDFLIEKDIIIITVAHRVGVFGFLKVNDTAPDANMGLKDIVMALKWIKKFVKQFGGDKRRITVMGSDSAASFLSLLLKSEKTNLFSKMILQSGSLYSPSLFQGNHILERQRLLQNLKKMGINDLLYASAEEIIKASQKIYDTKEVINFQRPVVPFSPIVENKSNVSIITSKPDDFKETRTATDLTNKILVGFNSQESMSEVMPFIHNTYYLKFFSAHFKFMVPFSNGCSYNYTSQTYREIAERIKRKYFEEEINEKSIDSFLRYTTDLKKYPIWKFIKAHRSEKKTKMYVYKFNYVGSFNAMRTNSIPGVKHKVKGAASGDEICYIFRCEPLGQNYLKNDVNSRDRRFIREITDLWANFIKTGDPNPLSGSGHLSWPPITLEISNLLLLSNLTRIINSEREDKIFDFWQDIYETFYKPSKCHTKSRDEL